MLFLRISVRVVRSLKIYKKSPLAVRQFFNCRGFTITELAIAATLTTIFAASFYAVFLASQQEMHRTKSYFDVNESARNVMDRFAKDTQEAVAIELARAGVSTGNNCLILKLPSISASGVPTNYLTQFDYVTYRINPNNPAELLRSLDVLDGVSFREGGRDVVNGVISDNMQSLLFSNQAEGFGSILARGGNLTTLKYFNVQLTTRKSASGTHQSAQLDSDMMLRNYLP